MSEELTLKKDDEYYMRLALNEARMAFDDGEVPIGAVFVAPDGRVIARAHNQKEKLGDPTAHAEMIAITQAAEALGDWRLEGVTVYSTIEPCVMCAGALIHARIARIVFGARDPKWGGCGSIFDIVRCAQLNHKAEVTEGLLAEDTIALLKSFFGVRR